MPSSVLISRSNRIGKSTTMTIQNFYSFFSYQDFLSIKDLLWSESYRGGCGRRPFGNDALNLFWTENNLSLLIRACQYNKQGAEVSMAGVITILSASSYQFYGSNKSGVLFISDINPSIMQNMDSINRMTREDTFVDTGDESEC